jgi:hypothetical protein
MPFKILSVFFLLLAGTLFGQGTTPDSTARIGIGDTSAFVMQKSPWTAVILSAVVPGAGQIYNKSYWKAPLVWGITGWFAYNYILNNKNYHDYRDKAYAAVNATDPNEQALAASYRNIRDDYRSQRDNFAIYLGITYALTLLDAYVDAQMFDFSVAPGTSQKTISFKYYFNR